MRLIPSERKYLEILRILKENRDPMGAKRLSEILAERGFVLTDRAVQYYLRYLDETGFTRKVGNTGRVLTREGMAETESALVDERIGFIISKLERLAFRSTFDPATGAGDVAYNLSLVPEEEAPGVVRSFGKVSSAGYGFFSRCKVLDRDPRVPPGQVGILSLCSITIDGIFQRSGIPVTMAYGGRLAFEGGVVKGFLDLVGYRGTTIDPLQLFISAGLTSIREVVASGTGVALANVREIPLPAVDHARDLLAQMGRWGFTPPAGMGNQVFNTPHSPHHVSIVSYSGMNMVGHGIEEGYRIRTEIGAGTIPFSKLQDSA
ncbi:MAG TPA: NrpR regulatory domain-containing protein [Methanomicrobiales archaeon]|jgi:repressor of nif and glnA expression|nr:NrpR regulatory domain-containing protein [Methanomicrobiales archaeon]